METIYSGEFVSRDDVRWTVEIEKETGTSGSVSSVGELSFAGEGALTIEWTETSKRDVLCGSVATVTLISPGDRTYADLYTIEPGKIRLRVKRDGELWWMGCLDPEFYEEPYTDNSDYEVELTFSDFGILERLKYDMSGLQSMRAVIEEAMERAKIEETIDESYISTKLSATEAMPLSAIGVESENWTDEDGEVSTLKDVLEGLLTPLGVRMMQKCGRIWLYDLNGALTMVTKKMEWMSDDQVMGTDEVANAVKITFSPYAKGEQSEEVSYTGDTDTDYEFQGAGDVLKICYFQTTSVTNVKPHGAWMCVSFKLYASGAGKGLGWLNGKCRYFKMLPLLGGEECEGVAYGMKYISAWMKDGKICTDATASDATPQYGVLLNDPAGARDDEDELMKTKKMWLPGAQGSNYGIRLRQEVLVDARYNPTVENDDNSKTDYDEMKSTMTIMALKALVRILDKDGKMIAAYDNRSVKWPTLTDTSSLERWSVSGQGQGWKTGADATGAVCYLQYYDKTDMTEGCAIGGWKTNRHYIGMPTESGLAIEKINENSELALMGDGQYIPYPPVSGMLEVTIMCGVEFRNYTHHGDNRYVKVTDDSDWNRLKWLLYKAPVVEIVKNEPQMSSVESDDVEYSGELNKAAKDDISIDTVCGTMRVQCPTSKGVLRKTSDGSQVMTLCRAGRTEKAEKLLIGTLCSQYAERKTKLTGTIKTDDGGMKLWTDGCQGDKKFICVSEVENVDEGTSEVVMIEVTGDEYESEN